MTKKPMDQDEAKNARAKPANTKGKKSISVNPDTFSTIVSYSKLSNAALSEKLIHHLVSGQKPCICEAAGDPGSGQCLRFWLTDDGQYNHPPGGEPVNCGECQRTCGV